MLEVVVDKLIIETTYSYQRFHKPLWGRRSPEIVPLFFEDNDRMMYQWSAAVKTRRWCSPPAWATPPAQPFQPNKFSETMVASVILHQVCLPTYPNLHGHICCFQTAFGNCGRFQAVVTFDIETMPSLWYTLNTFKCNRPGTPSLAIPCNRLFQSVPLPRRVQPCSGGGSGVPPASKDVLRRNRIHLQAKMS